MSARRRSVEAIINLAIEAGQTLATHLSHLPREEYDATRRGLVRNFTDAVLNIFEPA